MAATSTNIHELDDDDRDDLDEFIAECDRQDPGFAALVEKKLQERLAARSEGSQHDDVTPSEESAVGRAE